MKQYVIYGASDDLIEVDGAVGEEYNPVNDRGTFKLANPSGRGVRIHVAYEVSGCWSVGVSPLDEDQETPEGWTFALVQGTDPAAERAPSYSMALVADVGDDAELTWEVLA